MMRTFFHFLTLTITVLLFFCYDTVVAQQEIKTFRKNNEEIVKDSTKADYIRIIKAPNTEGELFELTEYYLNQQLKRTGKTLKKTSPLLFHGLVTTYYKNGQKKSEENYDKGKQSGKAIYFYPNGQVLKEVYTGRKMEDYFGAELSPDTLLNYYDSLGNFLVKEGQGFVKETKENGEYEQGNYVNGVRSGEWNGKLKDNKHTFKEWYEHGLVTSGSLFNRKGEEIIYTARQVQPNYPGGIHNLRIFIANRYRYPEEAIRAKVSGRVEVTFVVDKNGRMTDYKVVKDLGYGTGAEVIKILKKASHWTPGYQRGLPVRVQYSLPIVLK